MFEAVLIVGAFGLVEVVHVQLSDERGEVVVFEEAGQNRFRKLVLFLDYEGLSVWRPRYNGVIFFVLIKTYVY